MQVLPAKRLEESCTGRYLRELRIQNGKHLVNLMNQISLKRMLYFLAIPTYNKLARSLLLPVESTTDKN